MKGKGGALSQGMRVPLGTGKDRNWIFAWSAQEGPALPMSGFFFFF